jgi:hypothetical protein
MLCMKITPHRAAEKLLRSRFFYVTTPVLVGDLVLEKTIGERPWVPEGGPRGVGIVGVLSKESRINRSFGEVVISTLSQQ